MSVKVINQKSITTRYKCIEQKKKKTNILSVLTTTANVYQPSPTTCGTLMIPQKTISKPIAVVAMMVDLWEIMGFYLCTQGENGLGKLSRLLLFVAPFYGRSSGSYCGQVRVIGYNPI